MGWRSAASWVWSAPQRAVLSVLVGAMLLVIIWRAAVHRTHLDDPPPANPPRAPFLADRIDLNTADRDMLVTLPGIGPSRAQAIIDYRDRVTARGDRHPVFTRAEDLLYIDGFGMAMVEQLRLHLAFPDNPGGPNQ